MCSCCSFFKTIKIKDTQTITAIIHVIIVLLLLLLFLFPCKRVQKERKCDACTRFFTA